jgi:hypothetical protein
MPSLILAAKGVRISDADFPERYIPRVRPVVIDPLRGLCGSRQRRRVRVSLVVVVFLTGLRVTFHEVVTVLLGELKSAKAGP